MKGKETICKELDAKIPRDVISKRDGGAGRKLDYLETWYVIARLNEVFGNLNWCSETLELVELQGTPNISYRAKVRISVRLDDGTMCFKEGTGYGNDKGKMNPHELGAKEAESDALKRAAMKFGMSLGLALYDKSQENVDDGQEVVQQYGAGKKNTGRASNVKPASVSSPQQSDSGGASGNNERGSAGGGSPSPDSDEKAVKLKCVSTARVAIGLKKAELETLIDYVSDKYKVPAAEKITPMIESLSPKAAGEFLGYLEKLIA